MDAIPLPQRGRFPHAMRTPPTRRVQGMGVGDDDDAALMQAWMDWAIHLAAAPGKRMLLAQKAQRKAQRFARYALNCALASTQSAHAGPPRCIEPLAQDKRFASDSWTQWPFNLIHQGFLLNQQFWHCLLYTSPSPRD